MAKARKKAAYEGSKEVISAVVAGTMTNLATVLPFLLITGLAALLFRELIFTISFAIIASLLAAVTIVPSLMAMFESNKRKRSLANTWLFLKFNSGFERARSGYLLVLARTLRYRWFLIITSLILLVGSIWLIRGVGTEFLPSVDDGRITFRFTLPLGTSIEPTNEVGAIIQETIEEMPYVATHYMTAGGYFRGGQISVRGGMIDGVIQLVPHNQRRGYTAEQWVTEFSQKMRDRGLPFIQQRIRGPRIEGLQTSLVEADIAVGIVGDDLDELESLARAALQNLQGIDGIGSIQIGNEERVPQMLIRVDEDRASRFQLTSGDVAVYLNRKQSKSPADHCSLPFCWQSFLCL